MSNKKDGFELLCVFYVAEKFVEINAKEISSYLQKRGISYKHFAASQLLTLFTSAFIEQEENRFLHQVWQVLVSQGWGGFFRIFTAILISIEAFVLVAAMEDMIMIWDSIFRSSFVQRLEGKLDLGDLSDRIDPRKIMLLDLAKLQWTLENIAEAASRLAGNEETVRVMAEEFLAIHQKIKDILLREKISVTNLIKDF